MSATVTSTLDVAMVRAHMGTVDVAMTPIPALPGQWSAAMDLTSLPYGNVTLTITATDIAGASASASRDYVHDEPPRITVTSPEVNTVARPMLHVVATCTDDAPGNACNQFGAGVQIGSTQGVGGAIDHTFDLTSIDGSAVTLVVTARDSVGHQARVDVPVFVEASPDLTEIISVGRRVLDIDATRVLYSDSGGRVHVRQRTGGADAVVGMIADVGFRPAEGHLTSTGAVWVSMPGAPSTRSAQLIAWRGNGAAAQVGTMEVTNAPYIELNPSNNSETVNKKFGAVYMIGASYKF